MAKKTKAPAVSVAQMATGTATFLDAQIRKLMQISAALREAKTFSDLMLELDDVEDVAETILDIEVTSEAALRHARRQALDAAAIRAKKLRGGS